VSTLKRVKLVLPLLVALVLVGAAGLSSLKADDYCTVAYAGAPDGTSWSTSLSARPPGWQCDYVRPDGTTRAVQAGSWPWLAVALAGFAAVGAWAYRRRRSPAARLATASTIAMAAVGAFGLVGGFNFAFFAGCLVGVPLAWLSDVAFVRAEGVPRNRVHSVSVAFLSGVAVFAATALSLALRPVVAAALAVALAALSARLLKPRSAATAAPARPAP
jgi:hypothetical protein